jgi:hypothetical protein
MVDPPPQDTTVLLTYEHDDARIFMLCLRFLKCSFNTHTAGCQPNSQHGIYTYQHQWRQKWALVPQLLVVTLSAIDCPTVGLSHRYVSHAHDAGLGTRQSRRHTSSAAVRIGTSAWVPRKVEMAWPSGFEEDERFKEDGSEKLEREVYR